MGRARHSWAEGIKRDKPQSGDTPGMVSGASVG